MKNRPNHSYTVCVRLMPIATAIILLSNTVVYGAGISPPKLRVSAAGDKFDGVTQVAATFEISRWRFLRAHHIELGVGSVTSSSGNGVFAIIGPVWRTPLVNDRFFADIGIAPTLISASRFGGRDLGGYLHFTSFVSVGMRIGGNNSLALRIQHTSNGGLGETNPGMDMLGLELSFSFSE